MYSIINAIAGYFFLLLLIRLLKRRPGAQMTPFEFVLVFLMGGVIILATVGDDRSMTNCIGAVITIGLMHRLVAGLKNRSRWFQTLVDGTPLVLLKDGQWQTEVMSKMKMHETDVMAAARTKGIKTLQEIKYAILERNGGISVIKADGGE